MQNQVNTLVNYIRNLSDFEILDIATSYTYFTGNTFSLSVDNSRNLTNNNMGATIIDGILQAGLNYDNVVKPRIEKFKSEYPNCTTTNQIGLI